MTSFQLAFFFVSAATAFFLLAILVTAGYRGNMRSDMRGGLFAAAAWIATLWAAVLAAFNFGYFPAAALPLIEWLRIAVWLMFVVSLGSTRPQRWQHLSATAPGRRILVMLGASLAVSCAMTLWPQWLTQIWVMTMLLLAVAGMVALEGLYRQAEVETRWRLKFLCLGLGGLLAYDFILYADLLLFRVMNPVLWAARGIVSIVMVPLLAVAAARNRSWAIDIQISRHVVFHSGIGLISGLYLLGLALGGYYIRYYGGAWGELAQIVVLFMGAVFFIALLASRQFRSSVRVYVSKHFFSYQFDYREQWVKFTSLLSSNNAMRPIEECALEAIGGLVESPRGQLWLRNGADFEMVATRNMEAPVQRLAANASLVQFLSERHWVIDLQADLEVDIRPMIPDWLQDLSGVRLIVPLLLHDELIGFVLLSPPHGGLKTNWEVNDLLKVAGRQAASYLAQARAAKDLLVARQFESFNKMSAFIVHDLKNLVSQLDLVLTNAPRLIERPEFQQDMLDTVSNSVQRMKRLLNQLQDSQLPSQQSVVLNVQDLCQRAVQSFKSAPVVPQFTEGHGMPLEVVANPERLERVIRHLLANAQDAVLAANGSIQGPQSVRVACEPAGDRIAIVVQDNGIGMAPEFVRTRLFQPFESTKRQGTGLGMYESREYVRSLGGEISVDSTPGQGTEVRIVLPHHVPANLQ